MISQLGKYEIRRELGRGAMGVVYEALDPLIKRRVALKTIRPDQLTGERPDDVVARFRREAQAAGRLNHPNIVSIYECDEDDGTWFIAMEFVDGRELKEAFANEERFRPADVERIMSQILSALDYSHRQGVVHRDVKPANIFLLADGTVKVADFGIAHIESSNLTQVGTVVGTPNYMSPEQIMGLPVDGRSDIFSSGVILYQFLTGERPFAGSSTTTMQKVLKEDPLPPSTLNVQLPPAIDAVVRKALAKRADDRYQTAQVFANALRDAMPATPSPYGVTADPDATLPSGTTLRPPSSTPASTPAAALSVAATTPMAAPSVVATTPASQKAAIAVVAGIGVIGLLALAATWWLWPRGDAAPRTASAPAVSAPAPSSATTGVPNAAVNAAGATSTTQTSAIATPNGGALSSAAAPTVSAKVSMGPAVAQPTSASGSMAAANEPSAPGTLMISALGLADASDPRYANDKTLLQSDARMDSKQQLVEKALVLLLDRKSLASNYDVLQSKLIARPGDFISTIVREGEPQLGKDGLMSITTQAVVNVKAVQQSLNQLSRDERVSLIRANGDPRVAVRIAVRDADRPDIPPQPSAIAENVLKERIRSFGFRTWSDDAASGDGSAPEFLVTGEASVKRLTTRLAASGLTITKYALSSWTVKCTNRMTGEEVYFNTTLPRGLDSWASEEEALRVIGEKVADQFSRDLFLSHVNVTGRKIALALGGMPDATWEDLLLRELIGLPGVISARAGPSAQPRLYDVQLATTAAASDAIGTDVVAPLNAKLGRACFSVGAVEGARVAVAFDPQCADPMLRMRLETNPPAGLYGAPPARQKAIIKNPDTLRKLV